MKFKRQSWVSWHAEPLESRRLLSKTIYVDSNPLVTAHDGTTWTTAYKDLQQALSAAASGDQILVADGTYKPTSTTSRTATFTLKNGVALYGGYAGYGAADPNARDIVAYPSILSGDIGVSGSITDNSYHVVTASSTDNTAVLDGFTITLGNANQSSGANSAGGGLTATSGNATISNCTFSQNAAVYGGGVSLNQSSPSFINCTFTANTATTYGGAIYESSSSPTISSCTFSQNSATSFSGEGAGIFDESSTPGITGCTFSGNSAYASGGAIYGENDSFSLTISNSSFSGNTGGAIEQLSASLVVTSCTFTGNSGAIGLVYGSCQVSGCTFTGNSTTYGGAICAQGGAALTLSQSTLTRNSASLGGAIYLDSVSSPGGTSALSNCFFLGNTAASTGGAMYVGHAVPTTTDCVFSGNFAAGGGGAILCNAGSAGFVNCTFSGNQSYRGGAIDVDGGVAVANCIIWANTTEAGGPIYGGGTVGYSDVQGGFSGAGNLNATPGFVRLPSPGSDGTWGTADDDYGDLEIGSWSPVVDAGNNSVVGSTFTTDLAGRARHTDVPTTPDIGVGTAPIIDMGAYEAVPALQANAGGPYTILQGSSSIKLMGYGSSDVAGPLQFDWDFTGSGQYNAASGTSPVIGTASYPADTILPISLRVTDSQGRTTFSNTTLTILPLTVYVDSRVASGDSSGSSWSNAKKSLADALSQSISGQTIEVAQGTYTPTPGTNRAIAFDPKPGVVLRGGYAGLGAANPDARDVNKYPTVLSGDIGTPGNNSDNSYSVVRYESSGQMTLDGFVITGGNANQNNDPYGYGGGIYLGSTSPTITNCVFSNNSSLLNGGAIYGNGSGAQISSCTFLTNKSQSGGAVSFAAGTPTLLQACIFDGNVGTSWGGAIYLDDSTANVIECSFSENASPYGGAVYDNGTGEKPEWINCVFSGNGGLSAAGLAPAIDDYQVNPSITNCIFWGNVASSGGPILTNSGTPTITYSDVEGGATGTGNISVDPLFVTNPSANSDGTRGTSDDSYGNLRLQATSPAIDVASNSAVPSGVTTDLDGNARFVDIPGIHDPGAIADMGPWERQLAPVASSTGYAFNSAIPSIAFNFTNKIDPTTLSNNDLSILTAAGQPVTGWNGGVSLDSSGLIATWTLSNLADGNYVAILPAASVANLQGTNLTADDTFQFFSLTADANHDRTVNALDFNALATNYGKPATFSQGDFDYSGTVDSNDFALLASHYGNVLAVPSGSALPAQPLATSLNSNSVNLFAEQRITSSDVDRDLLN